MDKGGSLDWATFPLLPLTHGKALVIPPSKVTSQGGLPSSCPPGRNDCYLSKGCNNYAVHLCIREPRSVLYSLESLRKCWWRMTSLACGVYNCPTQKQTAEWWLPGMGAGEVKCWSKGTKFQLYKMSKF